MRRELARSRPALRKDEATLTRRRGGERCEQQGAGSDRALLQVGFSRRVVEFGHNLYARFSHTRWHGHFPLELRHPQAIAHDKVARCHPAIGLVAKQRDHVANLYIGVLVLACLHGEKERGDACPSVESQRTGARPRSGSVALVLQHEELSGTSSSSSPRAIRATRPTAWHGLGDDALSAVVTPDTQLCRLWVGCWYSFNRPAARGNVAAGKTRPEAF